MENPPPYPMRCPNRSKATQASRPVRASRARGSFRRPARERRTTFPQWVARLVGDRHQIPVLDRAAGRPGRPEHTAPRGAAASPPPDRNDQNPITTPPSRTSRERQEPLVDRRAACDALGFAERVAQRWQNLLGCRVSRRFSSDACIRRGALRRGAPSDPPAPRRPRSAASLRHPRSGHGAGGESSAVPRQISMPRPLAARSRLERGELLRVPADQHDPGPGRRNLGRVPAGRRRRAAPDRLRATNVSASRPQAFHPSADRAATPIAVSFVPPTQTGGAPGGRSGPVSAGVHGPPGHGLPRRATGARARSPPGGRRVRGTADSPARAPRARRGRSRHPPRARARRGRR